MKLTLGKSVKRRTDNDMGISELSLNSSDSFQIPIKVVKSKDVSKNKQIELKGKAIYQFDCIVEDNHLSLILSEIDVLAPFVYQKDITLEELIKINKIFKACDDLNEVKHHIQNLFEKNMIELSQKEDEKDKITFKIKAHNISLVEKFEITAYRVMTEYKVPMLMKLYNIEKLQDKYIGEIKSILQNNENNDLCKKIKDIIDSAEKNMK
jgi:hypothetical protein